jgi:hypothetical protein
MLTLDEFFKKLDSGKIQPSTMIVRLRYKYSFETEFIEENELLMYECDRNGAPVFVWENDWDEGQTSDGEVYVMGWIDVDDVKVPGCEDDEPELRHGRWIEHGGGIVATCSNCYATYHKDVLQSITPYAEHLTRHCPNCGARMDLRTPTEVQLDEADYEPSVLADGSLNPDGAYGRMR